MDGLGWQRTMAILAVTLWVAVSPPCIAQDVADAQGDLDEIVVVAHRQPRPAHQIAGHVSTFSGEDFRDEMGVSITDMLRYSPGIDFQSASSRFGAESINIRGIAGNRVAVLLDGVPISDQFDVGSFSNATRDLIDAGFVDRIEVLRGPASALYGGSAIGGVVSMTTNDPRQLTRLERASGRITGAWRSENNGALTTMLQAFGNPSRAVLAGISVRSENEIEPADADVNPDQRDSDGVSAILKLAMDAPGGGTFHASAYFQNTEVESTQEAILGSGRFRSTTALDGDDQSKNTLANVAYEFDSSRIGTGILRAYAQETEVRQETYDERGLARRPVAIDRLFLFDQTLTGLEGRSSKNVFWGAVRHRISAGIDVRSRKTEELRDGIETGLEDGMVSQTILGEVFPLRDFPISDTDEWGVFVEDSIAFENVEIIAALRLDHYSTKPRQDAIFAEDYPFVNTVSISDSEVSPKLAGIWHFSERAEAYFQYSHGFRAPPYEDANIGLEIPFFNIRAIPNPDLKSERSDNYELGLRWRTNNTNGYVSLFHTRFDQFIESRVRLGPDPVSGRILFQAQNIDSATLEGAEVGVTIGLDSLLTGLSVDGDISYVRGRNRDSDQPLNSVAPPQAAMRLAWQSDDARWRASLRATLVTGWDRRDESSGPLFKPAGYATFDVHVTRQLTESIRLRAGINNLTDRTYWQWTRAGGLSPDDPTIPFLSQPARSFALGIDVAW